jgi:uncharacterized membrane protein YczE
LCQVRRGSRLCGLAGGDAGNLTMVIHTVHRLLRLVLGLFMFGFGTALMLRGELGTDPWTVFAQGLSIVTGVSIGVITVAVGLAVLLLWIPLKQRPGVGTVANALLIGPFMELGLFLIDTPPSLALRAIFFATGLLMVAIGSGWYLGSRLGPGPRDGLMTGLHRRFGWPLWAARTGIEVTVVVSGWLLGGTVGWGTAAFALLIGPLVQPAVTALTMSGYPENRTGK